MLKELADTPHIRDFVALVGREMRGKATERTELAEKSKHGAAEKRRRHGED
jgi:hypothetical protein